MDDGGFFGRVGKLFSSMAWTWPTAMFFSAIVIMLLIMTVWEIGAADDRAARLAADATTRGDRLFIGLLGAAWIHLGWLMGSEQALWIGSIIAADLVSGRDAVRLSRAHPRHAGGTTPPTRRATLRGGMTGRAET